MSSGNHRDRDLVFDIGLYNGDDAAIIYRSDAMLWE